MLLHWLLIYYHTLLFIHWVYGRYVVTMLLERMFRPYTEYVFFGTPFVMFSYLTQKITLTFQFIGVCCYFYPLNL